METGKRILVALPVSETQKEFLKEKALQCSDSCQMFFQEKGAVTAEDLKGVNAILGNLPPDLVRQAKDLEWIQLDSAGADQYTKKGILRDNTILTNASGAYGLAVSEHMIAMVFDLVRKFPQYYRNQFHHEWQDMGPIISIEGARILILGVGDIGGEFARKMKALGAITIGVRRTNPPKPEYLDEQVTLADLDDCLPKADIVAMVLPGGQGTYHLMDEKRLREMKKGAYLINVGRGSSIDTDALRLVLSEGWLGGCALDVTDPEPLPKEDPLWEMENVLITPHIAGFYNLAATVERIVQIAGENLENYLTGKPLKNQVDFETGYCTPETKAII